MFVIEAFFTLFRENCLIHNFNETFLEVVLIFTFINYKPSEYADYKFQTNAEAFGWILSVLSLICIPIFALYQLIDIIILNKKVQYFYNIF